MKKKNMVIPVSVKLFNTYKFDIIIMSHTFIKNKLYQDVE